MISVIEESPRFVRSSNEYNMRNQQADDKDMNVAINTFFIIEFIFDCEIHTKRNIVSLTNIDSPLFSNFN